MTLPENPDRENILLSLWKQKFTVENASLESGIPKGSISYYYKRFNKDPEEYRKRFVKIVITQNNSFLIRSLKATKDWNYIIIKLEELIGKGDYAKANEFLKFTKLFDEIQARHIQKRKDLNLENISIIENERINQFNKMDEEKFVKKGISKTKSEHIPAYELYPLPKNNEKINADQISLDLMFRKSIADLFEI